MRDNRSGVNNLLVSYVSGNMDVATINGKTGDLQPLLVGRVTFYASTYAYGVAAQDSLQYEIGYPIVSGVNRVSVCGDTSGGVWTIRAVFPKVLKMGVGGQAQFTTNANCPIQTPATDTLTFIFDDTTVVPGGKVTLEDVFGRATITINKAGTFTWHIDQYGGVSGAIMAISGSGP